MSLQLIEAARQLRFKPEQGWPETFTTDQATWMQAWQQEGARRRWEDLRSLLALALKAGTVQVTTTTATRSVEKSKTTEVTFASAYWDGVPGKRRVVRWVESVEVETHHIAAQHFAAWLATNKIEPSRHVAAWLEAAGVSTAREQPQQPAPVVAVPAESRRILKTNALIAELEHEWPSIRADLKEASRRGNEDLKTANVKHGHWDVEMARKWADSRGKLKKAARVHHLSEWPGRVTRNRA